MNLEEFKLLVEPEVEKLKDVSDPKLRRYSDDVKIASVSLMKLGVSVMRISEVLGLHYGSVSKWRTIPDFNGGSIPKVTKLSFPPPDELDFREFKRITEPEIKELDDIESLRRRRFSDELKVAAVGLLLTKKATPDELSKYLKITDRAVSRWTSLNEFIPEELKKPVKRKVTRRGQTSIFGAGGEVNDGGEETKALIPYEEKKAPVVKNGTVTIRTPKGYQVEVPIEHAGDFLKQLEG